MEQVELQISRAPTNISSQAWDAPHDFREFVHRHANEINLSGDGAIEWVIGVTKSRSKSKCPVIVEVIGPKTERFSLRRRHPPVVAPADRICRRDGPACASCGIVVSTFRVTYQRISEIGIRNTTDESITLSQRAGAGHCRHSNVDIDEIRIIGRELQSSVVACGVDVGDVCSA